MEKKTNVTMNWLEQIAKDGEYWITDAENMYPSVIAYEYKRLRDLCREKQPFGVLLALKDNFEAFIKLETLLAFAWASHVMDEGFFKKTIVQLATPNLSMGAWVELAALIIRDLKKNSCILPEIVPLETIRKFYQKKEIVNWRNSKIGHGAMGLAEDLEFQEDIRGKILLLKELYTLVDMKLKNQKLILIVEDKKENRSERLLLAGAEKARQLPAAGLIEFQSACSDISFSVDPYIVIRKHEARGYGVYFFDNQKTPSITFFQAYADGSHKNEAVGYFAEMRKMLDNCSIKLDAASDDIYLSEAESRELDLQHMSHDFVKPDHLVSWLKDCVRIYDKGLFYLKMNRGTGKSVFAEKLNRLFGKPVLIDEDLDVRTYHFGRSQSAGCSDFQSYMEWMWANEFHGGSWLRIPHISDYEKEGLSRSEALARFLGEVRKYSSRNRGCEKILLVLDGLDEITEEELWDFLPSGDILEKGIYFLVISRDPDTEDLPEEIKERLNRIKVNETLVVDRTAKDNVQFLMNYINSTALKRLEENAKKKLIELADYRTLQLGLLCKLAEAGMPISELPHSRGVVSAYLKMLNDMYGEKEAIYIREVLAVLCTVGSFETLTLQELGAMTYQNAVTLKLVGLVRDLSPLLQIDRGEGGNRFSIVNQDVSRELMEQLPETDETILGLVRYALALIKEELGENTKSEPEEAALDDSPTDRITVKGCQMEAVVAYMEELCELCSAQEEILGTKEAELLSRFSRHHIMRMVSIHERRRAINYQNQVYLMNCRLFGETSEEAISSLETLAGIFRISYKYEQEYDVLEDIYAVQGDDISLENWVQLVLYRYKFKIISLETAKKILEEAYAKAQGEDSNIVGIALSKILMEDGQYEKAADFQEKILDNYMRMDTTTYEYGLRMASVMRNYAETLCYLLKMKDGLSYLQKAYEIEKNFPESIIYSYETMTGLADIIELAGAKEEAYKIREELCHKAIDNLGSFNEMSLIIQKKFADACEGRQIDDKTQLLLIQIYENYKKFCGECHHDTNEILYLIIRIYISQDKYKEAYPLAEKYVEQTKNLYADDSIKKYISEMLYAEVLSGIGHIERAREILNKIISQTEKQSGFRYKIFIEASIMLAKIYYFHEHDFLKAIHTMETLYLKCTQAGSTYIKNVIDCLETLIDILEDVQPDNKIDAYWKKRQLNYWHHQLHVAKKSAGIRKETSFGRLNNIMNVEKTFGNFTGSIINERLKEFKTEFEQKSLVLEWVISQNKEMGMLLLSVGMIITFLLLGDWKYVWSDIQENGFLCLRTYMVKTAFCTGIPFGFLCLNRLGFFGVYSDSGDGGMLYTKLIDGYMLSAAYYFTVYILYKGVFFSGITSFADRFLRDLVGTVGGTLQGMVNSYDIGLFIGFVLLAHFYICGLDYIEYFWLRKLEKNRKCKDCL